MSLILALFYFYGAGMVHTLQKELSIIAAELGLRTFVDVKFLKYSLQISGVLCCLCSYWAPYINDCALSFYIGGNELIN